MISWNLSFDRLIHDMISHHINTSISTCVWVLTHHCYEGGSTEVSSLVSDSVYDNRLELCHQSAAEICRPVSADFCSPDKYLIAWMIGSAIKRTTCWRPSMVWTRSVSNFNLGLKVEVTDGYIQSTGVKWWLQHPPVGGRTRDMCRQVGEREICTGRWENERHVPADGRGEGRHVPVGGRGRRGKERHTWLISQLKLCHVPRRSIYCQSAWAAW